MADTIKCPGCGETLKTHFRRFGKLGTPFGRCAKCGTIIKENNNYELLMFTEDSKKTLLLKTKEYVLRPLLCMIIAYVLCIFFKITEKPYAVPAAAVLGAVLGLVWAWAEIRASKVRTQDRRYCSMLYSFGMINASQFLQSCALPAGLVVRTGRRSLVKLGSAPRRVISRPHKK